MNQTKPQIFLFTDGIYKKFFKITDRIDCEFIKVKGHKKSSTKNEIDNIFTLVDKATRNALREYIL